jgi:hypothetical protein
MPQKELNFQSFKRSKDNSVIKEEPSVEEEESKHLADHPKVLYD